MRAVFARLAVSRSALARRLVVSIGFVALGSGAACSSSPGAPVARRAADPPAPTTAVPPVTAAAPDEPVPLGPLPAGVRPIRESLALDIDPAADRFSGTADIALHLDQPRARIWLHGRGLAVRSAAFVLGSGAEV